MAQGEERDERAVVHEHSGGIKTTLGAVQCSGVEPGVGADGIIGYVNARNATKKGGAIVVRVCIICFISYIVFFISF